MSLALPLRRRLGVVAATAVALMLAGCGGSGDGSTEGSSAAGTAAGATEPTKVNFGYIADFNGASLLAIAADQGIWDEYNLDVQTPVFTNGPLQIQAIGTGDLDFGYIGPGAFWLPMSGEVSIAMINTVGGADRVIAQPGITSIADLEGKSVAYPEGTSGDMILTLALEANGMTKDDIEAVPMDAAAIVTAFASGQVDAAAYWYPAIATIKEQVPDLVELAKNADFIDTMAFPTAFVVGNDLVADDPATVEAVLAALKEAMQWRTDNPEEAIQLTADMLGLDAADVSADAANQQILTVDEVTEWTENGLIDTWLSNMGDFFVSAGKLEANGDPATYYLGDMFAEAGN
ncbi:aliphatic sulfonate ABC transporter substrate-binding protein [Actinotalea sp. M2MS4P-6]|uniref:aliphatic sulfonate ABC transporter substrate-binding protein n=1 Tax=Actinotalea sp. M2MS4P-6 TaxID=2983762 RepID=UPI0021E3D991|nr:aliphatic sulfonate ABC transporter substrate-binding protein [Actinotalea sp. M2MS4P-6]MCV2396270.1 aliphatic sulfonate ABC transporter substrate-binding protein [Actinotalea sp. M2MS4P-6]